MRFLLSRGGGVAVLVAAVLAAGAIAYAAIPDSSGVIHGCYAKKDGTLRVIDTGSGESCDTKKENTVDWNVAGQPGPPGPAGPPGVAGSLGSLDDLDGIPCLGTRAHPGTTHVVYETVSRTEALATLKCVTTVVANPGPFTFGVTGGTLSIGLFGERPLPTSGWQVSGEIDDAGNVTLPGSAVQFPEIPFDETVDISGLGSVHAVGTISFAATGFSGFLDPESGDANLNGGAYAAVTITATAQILGLATQLYSGSCDFGTEASPIPVTLSTAPPGIPYSQSTGAATLASALEAPSLANCDPAVNPAYAAVLTLLAGDGNITLSGATDPILIAD